MLADLGPADQDLGVVDEIHLGRDLEIDRLTQLLLVQLTADAAG